MRNVVKSAREGNVLTSTGPTADDGGLTEHFTGSRERARHLSLSCRFLLAGGCLMVVAAFIAGIFVTDLVQRVAIEAKAASTALLMRSIVEPVTEDLTVANTLSQETVARVDRRLAAPALRERFPYLEIWSVDGVVVYSTTKSLIGRKFPQSESLRAAAKGEVAAEFSDLRAGEHTARNFHIRYLEVYAPIRDDASGRIIGIAEIHEHATALEEDLYALRRNTWIIIALVTLMILLGLFGIVDRGSKLIDAQTERLRQQVVDAEASASEIRRLQERSQRASLRLAELNENFLRRVGADLHDGPAQLLGFAAVKMDDVRQARTPAARNKAIVVVESALEEAMREIRTTARGLILPEITDLPLTVVLQRAADAHRARTKTDVDIEVGGELSTAAVPAAISACVFRFIQEGLQNAFRHAGAKCQKIACELNGGRLELSVLDRGDARAPTSEASEGLGLHGLRQRVESLGGSFIYRRRRCGGTRLQMSVDIEEAQQI